MLDFFDWSLQFEGYVDHMYLDIKGLVTIGVGNLLHPIGQAIRLPFEDPDGVLATPIEIREEWRRVSDRFDLARKGARAFAPLCRLRLPERAIRALVAERRAANQARLRVHYPGWDTLPEQARIVSESIAWALGSEYPKRWPKFSSALRAQDWRTAADECKLREAGNPGVIARNRAMRALMLELV